MGRNLAKEFGDFWKGGSYLFTQTPKEETITTTFRNGLKADYPRRDKDYMKSDNQVVEIVDNKTGEIVFSRAGYKGTKKDYHSSTGHLKDF